MSKTPSGRIVKNLMGYGIIDKLATDLVNAGHSVSSLKQLSEARLLALGVPKEIALVLAGSERSPIPDSTVVSVLFNSRWTCCVCRDPKKGVIIHHIREWSDSRSHAIDNLAVVCLEHHDEAHTRRGLTLSLSAERLAALRDEWYLRAPDIRSAEAANLAQMINSDHRLLSSHRGAMAWGAEEAVAFGNDGSESPRTRAYLKTIQHLLDKLEIPVVASGSNTSRTTWVLLVRTREVGLLSAVVQVAFTSEIEREGDAPA